MASTFARQTSAPITGEPVFSMNRATSSHQEGWEAGLFACCNSPAHLLTAVFFPCASAAYSARGINKFPVAIGIAIGLFFYGTLAFIALTVVDDDQPAVTIGGMEFKAWQTGAGWALINFVGMVFMLRGWFRAFHGIPGNKLCFDLPASFLLSCCTLAQMSKHTARVHSKCDAQHPATLQGYGV